MLQIMGIVIVEDEHNRQAVELRSKDYFLNFNVYSPDPKDRTNPDQHHHYRVSLWIKGESFSEWQEKIQPGKVFFVRGTAGWNGQLRTDSKFSKNTLKVNSNNFEMMDVPFKPV